MTRTIWTSRDDGDFGEHVIWNLSRIMLISEYFGEGLRDGDKVEVFERGKEKPSLTLEVGTDEEDFEVLFTCIEYLTKNGQEANLKLQEDKDLLIEVEEKELATYYTLKVNGEEARI